MYLDKYNTVVLEQCGYPGNIGDSCAESARMDHLLTSLDEHSNIDLSQFISPTGYLRHPSAPDGWRESDFSSDQALPLLIAQDARNNLKDAVVMEQRIHWRTGNGDIATPPLIAFLLCSNILINLTSLVQVLLFHVVYRWSDSLNKFEETTDSSCDYLNWIHASKYAIKPIRKLVSKDTLKSKVRSYYSMEPNSLDLINLYDKFIDRYY